jgi:carbonic anhydrase
MFAVYEASATSLVLLGEGSCYGYDAVNNSRKANAMLSRRTLLGSVAAVSVAASPVWGQDACAVFTRSRQDATTPDEALQRLKDGNARFVSGKSINCDLIAQVKATADGQAPFAAIVGCIDSRVPPELVFDQRIGDIFAARIAGNFVNTDIIGSLEFATRLAGAKLVVVLGHTECGAIKGAVDDAKLGLLTATLANIRPSVLKVTNVAGDRNSQNKAFVQAAADQNARDAAALLTEKSDVLLTLVKERKLRVVSAMHDVATGRVSWFN